MILTAITGSIGCGKTTISQILRNKGFVVYDIDKWVKYLYYKKDFLDVIKKNFPEVFDNNVFNKKSLRKIVFDNNDKLKILENLIHPFLTARLKKIIRLHRNKGLVFVDVALLFEMGWDKYFDFVVLADVDYETQKLRVMSRDNISEQDFMKINKLQMSREDKLNKVDFVVNTGGLKSSLDKKIVCLIEELKKWDR